MDEKEGSYYTDIVYMYVYVMFVGIFSVSVCLSLS